MRHSIQRALVALVTFAIGLGAVACWHGYFQRAGTARLLAGSMASNSPREGKGALENHQPD
jgi:hypothetical protein